MKFNEFVNLFKLRGKQRNTAESNRTKYDLMTDVTDVFEGYNHYINYLYEKLIRIFTYDNLPPTVPRDALENYILHNGFGGFTYNEKYGFLAVPATKYGVGLYPLYEPLAQYCTPLVQGKDLVIGRDIVIIKNNSYQLSCDEFVRRYARQLADVDSTLNILLSNLRMRVLPSFDNEESAESYKAVMVANRLGQVDTILDKNFIQKGSFTPYGSMTDTGKITDVITARNEILRSFLSEIGVTTANDKRERMVVDEVNNNAQMLLFNVADMLETRTNAVSQINDLYGLNITVKLSQEYNLIGGENTDVTVNTENKETGDNSNEN